MTRSLLCGLLVIFALVPPRSQPSLFVFPGLLMVGVSIFLTGLVSKSVSLLVSDGSECWQCDLKCKAFAALVFVICILYEALSFAALLSFNLKFRVATWKAAALTPVDDPTKVADPLCRLLAKIQFRLTGKFSGWGRSRGKFVKPKEWTQEPKRTERLLSHPLTFHKGNAADTLDAYGFALMARAGGHHRYATSLEFTVLGAQLVISVLNSIGKSLEPGSKAAIAQISVVLSVQAAHSLWVLVTKPSMDRIVNSLVGIQFLLEALQASLDMR